MIQIKTLYQQLLSTAEYCGVIERIDGDIRTHAPWAAAIYSRQPENRNELKFLSTGLITSPSHIGAYFGGIFGTPPETFYKIPKPENLFIGLGLNSTNLNHRDEFSQFPQVSKTNIYTQ